MSLGPPAPSLVLASASPRRRELLSRFGLEFIVRPIAADETAQEREPPDRLVHRLALAKARAAAGTGELALGADTVVALDDEILGKPRDAAEARRMLRRLSGREHVVWTAVAAVLNGPGEPPREQVAVERTVVRFRSLSASEIDAYVTSGEPLDKAGAYAIQGRAAAFVSDLRGSWSNVVGLPLESTARLLESMLGDDHWRPIATQLESDPPTERANPLSRRP